MTVKLSKYASKLKIYIYIYIIRIIKNEGYWVGRVELGFFICRKHSGTENTDQIVYMIWITNFASQIAEINWQLPVQMPFMQHLDRLRLG